MYGLCAAAMGTPWRARIGHDRGSGGMGCIPHARIVQDVVADTSHFIVVADDVFVVIAMPDPVPVVVC